jgi:hypothetical protein
MHWPLHVQFEVQSCVLQCLHWALLLQAVEADDLRPPEALLESLELRLLAQHSSSTLHPPLDSVRQANPNPIHPSLSNRLLVHCATASGDRVDFPVVIKHPSGPTGSLTQGSSIKQHRDQNHTFFRKIGADPVL